MIIRNLIVISVVVACSFLAQAQDQAQHLVPSGQKLMLSLECWKQGEWKAADVQTVFKQQDRLRFKFRSSVAGYLYILAQSSSGTVSWLYPVSGTQSDRLTGGHDLIVPSADGYFVIGGPPGFDTLFWIMRSSPMTLPVGHVQTPECFGYVRCPCRTRSDFREQAARHRNQRAIR
jgi:hypothetical protein